MSVPDADPSTALPAERELVARYWDRVRLFALRRTGNTAVAEDVAQETLRRVVEALRAEQVRDLAALPGFVFQTARHVCQHHARSVAREGRALERLHGAGERDEGADALSALVSQERRLAVRRALDRLGSADRALLLAHYYEQLDAADVARRLRLSAGAVRVRKHRALKRLAELLARNDSDRSGT